MRRGAAPSRASSRTRGRARRARRPRERVGGGRKFVATNRSEAPVEPLAARQAECATRPGRRLARGSATRAPAGWATTPAKRRGRRPTRRDVEIPGDEAVLGHRGGRCRSIASAYIPIPVRRGSTAGRASIATRIELSRPRPRSGRRPRAATRLPPRRVANHDVASEDRALQRIDALDRAALHEDACRARARAHDAAGLQRDVGPDRRVLDRRSPAPITPGRPGASAAPWRRARPRPSPPIAVAASTSPATSASRAASSIRFASSRSSGRPVSFQ